MLSSPSGMGDGDVRAAWAAARASGGLADVCELERWRGERKAEVRSGVLAVGSPCGGRDDDGAAHHAPAVVPVPAPVLELGGGRNGRAVGADSVLVSGGLESGRPCWVWLKRQSGGWIGTAAPDAVASELDRACDAADREFDLLRCLLP